MEEGGADRSRQGMKEEFQNKKLVQAFLLKNTESLRMFVAPSRSVISTASGGVTVSYVCPHCQRLLLED